MKPFGMPVGMGQLTSRIHQKNRRRRKLQKIDESESDMNNNMENTVFVRVPRHTGGSVAVPSAMQDPLS